MAELTQGERLQPSLLDRLLDDFPKKKGSELDSAEGAEASVNQSYQTEQRSVRDTNQFLNSRQLRECVKRDLAWLLNSGCLEDVLDLSGFPHVAESVLNYGMPDLTGIVASTVDTHELERILATVISRYEPRILKHSLKLKVSSSDEMNKNALKFEIECDVWGQPVPERMYLHSEIDLEDGAFNFKERTG